MPERFTRRILAHITHESYEPAQLRQLAEELKVEPQDYESFTRAVQELVESAQVVMGSAQTIALPPLGNEVTGQFRRNEKGFGFLIPDVPNAHGDLFVPAHEVAGAMTGDRVRAAVVYDKYRKRESGHSPYTGKIVEIIQRRYNRFTGTLVKQGKMFIVEPDGRTLGAPIVVHDPHAKNASIGDKVAVELTRYPEGNYLAEGVITEVLGEPGKPDVETDAICRVYNLSEKFPDEVVNHARQTAAEYNDRLSDYMRDRLDLRDTYIITIDPPDAKDYDDAISITPTERGIELGVHIADVAAFVTPGSPLDVEAAQRGNSAYLPRRVIPMLPEILSNGICSLQPNVPRLTRSAFMTYDAQGKVLSTRFARSIIRSAHRLTYLEAQALIDGHLDEARKHARYDAPYTDQLIHTLREMDKLSRTIRQRRLHDGMIVLDLPEVNLVYGEHGHVIDAEPEDDAFTHKLIEAFMVEANEAVARVFADLNIPLIRRIHPEPTSHDVSELRVFGKVAGFSIPLNPTRKDLQRLLDLVRGKPAAKAVHFAVLRTLTKAEYTPDLIGHFALASEHYTHFTSPIRRYPDLTVHHAMDALLSELGHRKSIPREPHARKILANRVRSDKRVMDLPALRLMGRHCGTTERNAEAAERELRNLLVMQLLQKHVGEEFEGTVTGVTGFGIFIQINKYLVEGMIRNNDLPGAPAERWKLNSDAGCIVAQRSGRRIAIGDQFTVRINQVNLARREMNLMITSEIKGRPQAGEPSAPPFSFKKKQEKEKHGKPHKPQSKGKQHRKGKRR